jgi:hypothetical protein
LGAHDVIVAFSKFAFALWWYSAAVMALFVVAAIVHTRRKSQTVFVFYYIGVALAAVQYYNAIHSYLWH